MTELYLSRLSLQRDASIAALAPLLLPAETGAQTGVTHRLIWTAFADASDRKRDFLWRQDEKRRWLVLSARPPEDPHRLFDIETKRFEPFLENGHRLSFALRANAVVTRKGADGRQKRYDVVMDRLRAIPKGKQRAQLRTCLAEEASCDWLAQQGVKSGFQLDCMKAVSYHTEKIPRSGKEPIELGLLDLEGDIIVETPELFLSALASGFGKAKGFGCGLMLIRRCL